MQVSRGWQSLFRLVQIVLTVLGVITITAEKGFSQSCGTGGSTLGGGIPSLIEFRKKIPVQEVRFSKDYRTITFSDGERFMSGRIAPGAVDSVVKKIESTNEYQDLMFFSDDEGRVTKILTMAELEAPREVKAPVQSAEKRNTEPDGLDAVISEYKNRKGPSQNKVTMSILGTCEYETDSVVGDGYTVTASDCEKSYFMTKRVKCVTDDGIEVSFLASCTSQKGQIISATECANPKSAGMVKQKLQQAKGTGAIQ